MMLEQTMPSADIGVIVGRFQVHELHAGHRDLIETVRARHQKVAIALGSTPGVLGGRNGPLDYESRRQMIQDAYPDVSVLSIKDRPDDVDWSSDLDALISSVFEIGSVLLYGSRDSFAPSYSGRYSVVELAEASRISGTEIRASISNRVRSSADFRHGVVYAAHNRFPVAYPTVDVAVTKRPSREVLLVRKRTDLAGRWRFVGGFVDPRRDRSLEAAAAREAAEEIPEVSLSGLRYVGSHAVDDWRYRSEADSIITSLFIGEFQWGAAKAGDDVHEARWFKVDQLADVLIPEHQPLGEILVTALSGEMAT